MADPPSPPLSDSASAAPPPEVAALRRLSASLDSLLRAGEMSFCADAHLRVGAAAGVAVHRCVLAARSPFFRALFSSDQAKNDSDFALEELVSGVRSSSSSRDALMRVLDYVYTGRVGPLPDTASDCVDERCLHSSCFPAVDFLLQVLSISSTFQIPELVSLYQRHLLEILDRIDGEDLPSVLAASGSCGDSCQRLTASCVELLAASDLDPTAIDKTLPPDLAARVLSRRAPHSWPDLHATRVHRALDSDDVELVRMLLKEGRTTLDDARAVHYAVAHCDSKIAMELLELGLADVSRRDSMDRTVLHLAARRKEPNLIVSLLTKGACVEDLDGRGRNALQIAKRVTRAADYYPETEQGLPTPKDKLCIEILEQAARAAPPPAEASAALGAADARTRLLYLENRVALARLLFPMEAKVAMEIAHVDGTLEFTLGAAKPSPADLNEEHISRIRALYKTVELGKRYFPLCSKVLDKITDDEGANNGTAWTATTEEQFMRKRRYHEIQEIVSKAFSVDKQESDLSALCSSSSSSSSSSSTALAGIGRKLRRK
ncbi:BTB/POZ domain and ankyrin repeat-containing protein NPR1-like [Wolffia australiana]